jgi:predicted RNase H-like HicB family nuclease
MLAEYLDKAMQHAQFEPIEDGTVFGCFPDLPDLKGVWADADSEETCRVELREVLEGWVLLHINDHTPVPPVDGLTVEAGSIT